MNDSHLALFGSTRHLEPRYEAEKLPSSLSLNAYVQLFGVYQIGEV